ncbi:MAG: hypothetical protein ACOZNI_13030 [Myxococcota bacterium]
MDNEIKIPLTSTDGEIIAAILRAEAATGRHDFAEHAGAFLAWLAVYRCALVDHTRDVAAGIASHFTGYFGCGWLGVRGAAPGAVDDTGPLVLTIRVSDPGTEPGAGGLMAEVRRIAKVKRGAVEPAPISFTIGNW